MLYICVLHVCMYVRYLIISFDWKWSCKVSTRFYLRNGAGSCGLFTSSGILASSFGRLALLAPPSSGIQGVLWASTCILLAESNIWHSVTVKQEIGIQSHEMYKQIIMTTVHCYMSYWSDLQWPETLTPVYDIRGNVWPQMYMYGQKVREWSYTDW